MEARDGGTIKIVDECKKAGLPEPEFCEEFDGFSVFFRKEKPGERAVDKLGETEGKILALIASDKPISIPVMAKKLGISTTAMENNLAVTVLNTRRPTAKT